MFHVCVFQDPLPPSIARNKTPKLCSVFRLQLLDERAHGVLVHTDQQNVGSDGLEKGKKGSDGGLFWDTLNPLHFCHQNRRTKEKGRRALLPIRKTQTPSLQFKCDRYLVMFNVCSNEVDIL